MYFHDYNWKASKKISLEEDSPMQWHMQARNVTTNLKVKVDFTLPTLRATNSVTSKWNVDDSAKGGYDMILRRDLLT